MPSAGLSALSPERSHADRNTETAPAFLRLSHFRTENRIPLFLKMLLAKQKGPANAGPLGTRSALRRGSAVIPQAGQDRGVLDAHRVQGFGLDLERLQNGRRHLRG